MDAARLAATVCCTLPAMWLGGEAVAGALGANPLQRLLHFSGGSALWLLLLALAVTPLRRALTAAASWLRLRRGRRLADWNGLVRARRVIGVAACAYGLLHAGLYATLDAGLDTALLAEDLRDRPHIAVGATALLLLLPLAATSFNAAVRVLGRWWRRLHLLAWPAAALAVAHPVLQARLAADAPWLTLGVFGLLLAGRLRAWRRGDRAAAAEVQRVSGTGPGAALPAPPRPANSR